MIVSDATLGAASVAVGEKRIYFLTRIFDNANGYTLQAEPFADHSFSFSVKNDSIAGGEKLGFRTMDQFAKLVNKNYKYLGADFAKRADEILAKPLSAKAILAESDVIALVKISKVSTPKDGIYSKADLVPLNVYKNIGFDWSESASLPYGIKIGDEYLIALTKKNGAFSATEHYNSLLTSGTKICNAFQKELSKGFEYKPYGKVSKVEENKGKNIADILMKVSRFKITFLSKEIVYEYFYVDSKSAKMDAARIDSTGHLYAFDSGKGNITTIRLKASNPHFYLKDNKVVFYSGSSKQTITILSKIYGKQFAGY